MGHFGASHWADTETARYTVTDPARGQTVRYTADQAIRQTDRILCRQSHNELDDRLMKLEGRVLKLEVTLSVIGIVALVVVATSVFVLLG